MVVLCLIDSLYFPLLFLDTPQANKFLIFKDFGLNQIGQGEKATE